ncbi:MAG: hypothetical protein N3A72_07125 [bacterium]|nr:hypothetical protein [bacterium]
MRKKKKTIKEIKTALKSDGELYAVNEPIALDSYCGYRDNEHPKSFLWRGQQYIVLRAIASWRVEEQEKPWKRAVYYRIETTTGTIFDCRYEELTERWVLVGTDLEPDSWPK